MPRKKGEWEVLYYLGVDGVMHQSHHRKPKEVTFQVNCQEVNEMNMFKVYWWIRGAGGYPRKQGHDIIETEIDFFDVGDAEERIQEDLDSQIPQRVSGSQGHFGTFQSKAEEESYKPNLPNFIKAHKEVTAENKQGMVSNWGVRKVTVSSNCSKG